VCKSECFKVQIIGQLQCAVVSSLTNSQVERSSVVVHDVQHIVCVLDVSVLCGMYTVVSFYL